MEMEKENLTNIVQISQSQATGSNSSQLVALCDDGSVWVKSGYILTSNQKWTLVNEGHMVLEEDTMSKKTKVPVLTDGLNIEVELCKEHTILRICNEKMQQFAFITLGVKEEHITSIGKSLNLSNFKVYDNLKSRK